MGDMNLMFIANQLLQIKPHPCISSGTITSIFKGFLARDTKICFEKYLRVKIKYLTDMCCENGYD